MNSYKILKEKHQKEVNSFPMQFAFSDKQFEEGMKNLGLDPTETDKVYSIPGGGFIRKTDSKALQEIFDRHEKEMKEAIETDKTGEGFIYDMFYYELSNHEYIITYDTYDAIQALGLTIEEVQHNSLLLKGLQNACKAQQEWYASHE